MDTWTNDQFVDNCGGYYDNYRNNPAVVRRFEDRFQAEQQNITNYMPCTCNMCGQELPTGKRPLRNDTMDTRYKNLVNGGWYQYDEPKLVPHYARPMRTIISQPDNGYIALPVNSCGKSNKKNIIEGISDVFDTDDNKIIILFMFIIVIFCCNFLHCIKDVQTKLNKIPSVA